MDVDIVYLTNQNCDNTIEPLLELYKGKLYCYLLKNFINDSINNLGSEIFSIKKSCTRTLTNILSGWFFTLYTNYDFSGDYFFPNSCENTDCLEEVFLDLCKYNPSIVDKEDKINKIITNLKNNYYKQLELLNGYKNSPIYTKNKNDYIIKKNLITITKKNECKTFYKFNITINYIIKDKKTQNIINNILIPVNVYNKLVSNYTGEKHLIDEYIWSILFRYQLLGSNNHQLAVQPKIMQQMQNDYNLNFECFASAINSTFKNYCSLYYDLERYFGSVGSFFNVIPIKGTFGFNPPYQKDIIEKGINRLINFLDGENELTFIITIPIWDIEGKKEMKEKYNNELEKQNIDYGDFEIMNVIKSSKYFRVIKMIPKEEFTYIDHNFELLKNKTIQNTYVIVLSNREFDVEKFNSYNYL